MPASNGSAHRCRDALVTGVATAIAVLLMVGVAQAVPASTPDDTAMLDGTSVRAIAQAGNLIWVGGNFDTVKDNNGATIRSVSDLVAFKADASGALAAGVNFPAVTNTGGGATVYDLSLLGNTLYLAGTFDKVDGQARSNVAAVDATTGALLPFNTNAGPANAVLATPTAIYVGTGKLLSFQPNGANTPGYTAPKTYIDATIRAHNTVPQVRDIKLQGSTLVATCQCDSITDINNPTAPGRLVKAVVEVNATTGALTNWVPANLPPSSGAFGISVVVHDFPGTTTPTVYLAAGGSDFTAAYDFATGAQRFKTDTSGSSQAITWYQGALVVGGHFNWTDSPTASGGCGDNASPNTACYHSPKLVSMDATTGKVILGADTLPWNPGICCAYNGVWALTTGDDGSTLHVGGEFTQVGGTWSGSGVNWTLNGAATQRYYARLGGPAVSIQTLTLTKAGTGTGVVTSNPTGINCGIGCANEQHDFSLGQGVTLTALPDVGSVFTGWTGGGCSGTGTCALTMAQAQNVTARFDLPTYTLSVSKTGGGAGTVTSAPAGVSCGTACSASFAGGTLVTLTAVPTGNNLFQGWGGACSGTAVCTVTMDAAKAVTAAFSAGSKLTVTAAGTGAGTITSIPAGITCPATCSANFLTGSTATITAAASAGSTFTGFTGGCVSATITCNVSMTGNKSVTATFAQSAQPVALALTIAGSGTVTSNPGGIDCAASCSANFAQGTSVTLTATPGANQVFAGWSGACTGTTTACTLSMAAALSVTAQFAASEMLDVTTGGGGTGSVTSSPGSIACPGTCSGAFAQGTTVVVSAVAGPEAAFTGWSGDAGVCGTAPSCPIDMSAARTVTATFVPVNHVLEVTTLGSGTGSVTGSPAGIDCPATSCSAAYLKGTMVTLSATADAGSVFTGWGGDCSGPGPCALNLSSDRAVTATFEPAVTHELTVSTDGGGTGSVTSTPGGVDCPATSCAASFVHGVVVTLTANPGAGSTFSGWGAACTGTGPCQVTMNAARIVSATFSVLPQLVHLDDNDPAVAYNGWRGVVDPAASAGAYRVSNVTNDTLTWKSGTTTSLAWVTLEGPDRGIADVNIDGVDKGNVDLYAVSAQATTLTYSGLSSKAHTVIITVTGTKNAASSGKDVVVDAFTAGASSTQESDAGVTFGTWKSVANASASGGSYRWASEATATVTATFNGTAIDWVTNRGGNFGKVAITIDGVSQGTVDLYASAQQWQSLVSYTGLAPGNHTLVIQVLNQKNAASGNTKIFVDGFTVHA